MRAKYSSLTLKDRIVIARYGGNFRGDTAKYAEAAGAAGLVIFTDPADGGYMTGLVYPEGRHASESTIQRGSLLTLDYTGDPLTPFEPALPEGAGIDVQRLDPADVPFHTIPVAPLPYGSAVEILRRMEGPPVPASWQGGLPFTYRLTGGAALTVRVFVDQPHRLTRIRNAFLRAEGLQFSAWSRSLFASSDPFSGYAPWMLPGLRYEVEEGTGESVAEWEAVYVRAVDDLTQRLKDVARRMRSAAS